MTAQTDLLHAGTIGHAPTATAPTVADLAADLERARAAARADPSPENLAAHFEAYRAVYELPWYVELRPVVMALALLVGLLVLFWFVGGAPVALAAVAIFAAWFAAPLLLRALTGDD